MATLYITDPGATLRKSGGSLIVTAAARDGAGKKTLLEVEPHRLELIALIGRAHVTSSALHLCLRSGIGLAWFRRSGRFQARLVPESPRSGDLRLAQYASITDPRLCLARARRVVDAKLLNAAEVLEALQSNRTGAAALSGAREALHSLRAELPDAESPDALLGHEGAGARTYFQALGPCFEHELTFTHRQRQPPPDPVNALLSFGYVLLGNLLAGRLEARGLDPALGFFHRPRSGRPSLALDLLEELRHPVVDRFVQRVSNLRILSPEEFEPDPEEEHGVQLTREGLTRFFQEWERHLGQPVRDRNSSERLSVLPLIDRQIERLVRELRGGAPYTPLHFGD